MTAKGSNEYFHNLSRSMILSLCNGHFTHFLICSSSKPYVLTQNPFTKKCVPRCSLLSSKFISNLFSNNCLIISRADLSTFPLNILNPHFGDHTIRTLYSYTACANLLKSFIKCLLPMFRFSIPHLKEVFLFIKSLSNPQSKESPPKGRDIVLDTL